MRCIFHTNVKIHCIIYNTIYFYVLALLPYISTICNRNMCNTYTTYSINESPEVIIYIIQSYYHSVFLSAVVFSLHARPPHSNSYQ